MKGFTQFSLAATVAALVKTFRGEVHGNCSAIAPNGAHVDDVAWLEDDMHILFDSERIVAIVGDSNDVEVVDDGRTILKGTKGGNALVVIKCGSMTFIKGWAGSPAHSAFVAGIAREKAVRVARARARREHEFASAEMRNALKFLKS